MTSSGATTPRVGVVGVCLDTQSYNAISHGILAVPGAVAMGSVDHYVGSEREVAKALQNAVNRICIIDYDQNNDEALWVTDRIRAEFPDTCVFAASSSAQPERIIAAMRAGCAEYLIKPIANDRLLDGIARMEAKQKERARAKGRRGKVITAIGAKGGTGVTSLALHLALHLAADRKGKTLLVDQHPTLGDASLYLGTGRHQYSFYELASNTDRLDEELLQGFLLKHESGLALLDAPEALDAVHYAPPASIEQTLGFLAEVYNYVVVDCPPGLTDATIASIAQSDQVAIVLTADLPSVRNAVRYIEHLNKLGYGSNNLRIVLNRHSKKGPLPDDKVEKALQRPISYRIPNNYAEVIRAINAGTPMSADDKSDFAHAIDRWAKELQGSAEKAKAAVAGPSRGGVLGIFGRSS
jgi:pilus assembly protein CpaE